MMLRVYSFNYSPLASVGSNVSSIYCNNQFLKKFPITLMLPPWWLGSGHFSSTNVLLVRSDWLVGIPVVVLSLSLSCINRPVCTEYYPIGSLL